MDKIHARIQESVYTKAEWEAANPVLLKGEKGFVSDDPNLFKIGDGVTAWNSLPWRGYTGTIAQVTGDNENAVMSQKATVAAIKVETARATAAEEANTQAIADEVARAKAAEEAIIFDVSSHNDGAVFESLQVLLGDANLSTLIPTSVRRGGMTIRFIQGSEQSSDNKYVQYRLMSDSFNITPANWQGVDDEPTIVSDNLVKSGGVKKGFIKTNSNIDIPCIEMRKGAINTNTGNLDLSSEILTKYRYTIIDVEGYNYISFINPTHFYIAFYSSVEPSSSTLITYSFKKNNYIEIPENAKIAGLNYEITNVTGNEKYLLEYPIVLQHEETLNDELYSLDSSIAHRLAFHSGSANLNKHGAIEKEDSEYKYAIIKTDGLNYLHFSTIKPFANILTYSGYPTVNNYIGTITLNKDVEIPTTVKYIIVNVYSSSVANYDVYYTTDKTYITPERIERIDYSLLYSVDHCVINDFEHYMKGVSFNPSTGELLQTSDYSAALFSVNGKYLIVDCSVFSCIVFFDKQDNDHLVYLSSVVMESQNPYRTISIDGKFIVEIPENCNVFAVNNYKDNITSIEYLGSDSFYVLNKLDNGAFNTGNGTVDDTPITISDYSRKLIYIGEGHLKLYSSPMRASHILFYSGMPSSNTFISSDVKAYKKNEFTIPDNCCFIGFNFIAANRDKLDTRVSTDTTYLTFDDSKEYEHFVTETSPFSDYNVTDLYIDNTNGNDENDGSIEHPMKTIEAAASLINSSSDEHFNVRLDGTYRLSSQITLNIPNKHVCFYGINNATINAMHNPSIIKQSDGIVKFACSKNHLPFIYVNGEIRLVASTKKKSVYSNINTVVLPERTTGTYNGKPSIDIPLSVSDYDKIKEIKDRVLVTTTYSFLSYKSKIVKTDDDLRTITVTFPKFIPHNSALYPKTGSWMVYENIPFDMECNNGNTSFEKGTFYTDGAYGYYKPNDNETVSSIEYPNVQQMFYIGNSDITFTSVKFIGSYYDVIDGEYYCTDWQGGYLIPATINVNSGICNFVNCEFTGISQHCVHYMNDAHDSIVSNCNFHDLGCGSVYIGELDQTHAPVNIKFMRNKVKDNGLMLQQSCAVIMGFADSCDISHNTISYCTYTGVTGGFVWDNYTAPTSYRNCRIHNNHIHHVSMGVLNDLGCIYTLGNADGLRIYENLCEDCSHVGIYLDEGSSKVVVENNITSMCYIGIFSHQCNNNEIKNNMIYNCSRMFAMDISTDIKWERNIFYYTVDKSYVNYIFGDVTKNKAFVNLLYTPSSQESNYNQFKLVDKTGIFKDVSVTSDYQIDKDKVKCIGFKMWNYDFGAE